MLGEEFAKNLRIEAGNVSGNACPLDRPSAFGGDVGHF
jgi:hypothetical protein